MNIEERFAEIQRIRLCGTQAPPFDAPRPYLIDYSGNPIPQDVIRALWPDLETAK